MNPHRAKAVHKPAGPAPMIMTVRAAAPLLYHSNNTQRTNNVAWWMDLAVVMILDWYVDLGEGRHTSVVFNFIFRFSYFVTLLQEEEVP